MKTTINRYRKPKNPIVIPERVARRAYERRVKQANGGVRQWPPKL